MQPSYSIIIPAYNEELTIERAVNELHAFCLVQGSPFEIVIVENGSSDKTWEKAQEFARTFESIRAIQSEAGKGYAIQEGWKKAYSPFLLFIDADLSPSLETLPRLLDSIKQTQGCAIADRFHKKLLKET